MGLSTPELGFKSQREHLFFEGAEITSNFKSQAHGSVGKEKRKKRCAIVAHERTGQER